MRGWNKLAGLLLAGLLLGGCGLFKKKCDCPSFGKATQKPQPEAISRTAG